MTEVLVCVLLITGQGAGAVLRSSLSVRDCLRDSPDPDLKIYVMVYVGRDFSAFHNS